MSEPVFVKVRNDQGEIYGSYRDYWRLVELSGFPTCELSEIDLTKPIAYIISPDNGNVAEVLRGLRVHQHLHRGKTILWQLERPGKVLNEIPEYFDEMWVSDRYHASLVDDVCCYYVPLGGHLNIAGEKGEPLWDFVVTAYLYGQREAKVEQLKAEGYTIAPNDFDFQIREYSLAHSRYGLCFHQDEEPVIEPLRFMLYACWRLPLIVEPSVDYFPYEVMPIQALQRGNLYPDMVNHNYERVVIEHPFKKNVLEALDA